MVSVVYEEFRSLDARSVPVDEHGFRVAYPYTSAIAKLRGALR